MGAEHRVSPFAAALLEHTVVCVSSGRPHACLPELPAWPTYLSLSLQELLKMMPALSPTVHGPGEYGGCVAAGGAAAAASCCCCW
jgi:hypothetical protein